jgi:hypothetical protein
LHAKSENEQNTFKRGLMKTSSIGKALSDRYGYGDMKEIARQIIRDENRKDSSPISNTSKAWRKLDQFLNLGSTKDLSLSDLSEQEKQQFLKMLSRLLSAGVVGYKVYEVNGKIEKHFEVVSLGNPRLRNAKVVLSR